MIAKSIKVRKIKPDKFNQDFMTICQDILASETSRVGSKTNQDRVKEEIKKLVTQYGLQ